MKALLLSMTCGEGHNAMARALKEQFDKHGIDTKIEQIFGWSEKREKQEEKAYLWAVKHIPHIYDYFWNKMRKRDNPAKGLPHYVKSCFDYVKKSIEAFQPDFIVSTHFYGSSILSYMKKHGLIPPHVLTGAILQDFCLCPHWEDSVNVDYIFQPYDDTTLDLIEKGFKEKQIKTFGLPLRSGMEQASKTSSQEARKKLELPEKFTVSIISGGGGSGNALKVIKSLIEQNLDLNIICVNGRNTKNQEKINRFIAKKHINNITNLGFVQNVIDYILASDVIISRCGSSLVSEYLALHKPFIAREKLILNEKITKQIFTAHGCALGLDRASDSGGIIAHLYKHPDKLEAIKNASAKFARPNSSRDIVNFLIEESKRRRNMEYLDLYDANGNKLGKTMARGDKNQKEGELFKLAHVWIKCKGKYLIQKASEEKGSEYAVSGGHVTAGTTSRKQAVIELEEELGLKVKADELKFLGSIVQKKAIFDVYEYVNNRLSSKKFKLQESEVESIDFYTCEEIDNLIKGGSFRKSSQVDYEKFIKNA